MHTSIRVTFERILFAGLIVSIPPVFTYIKNVTILSGGTVTSPMVSEAK